MRHITVPIIAVVVLIHVVSAGAQQVTVLQAAEKRSLRAEVRRQREEG